MAASDVGRSQAGAARGFSFVIPVYNSAERIGRCLSSIRRQDYPQENVQIVIADGGSTDDTRNIALGFGAEVIDNPNRLAEEGLRVGIPHAHNEFCIIFADDNELVERDWLSTAEMVFDKNPDVAAFWCRLASGPRDAPINRYFALIQSDPLSFFLNRNLDEYLKGAPTRKALGYTYQVFDVAPHKPLVWGANGLAFRTPRIACVWERESYLGDNDAFQIMLERGDCTVAYSRGLSIYHHHVNSLWQWRGKWKRNFEKHFLQHHEARNLDWLYVPGFKMKLVLWTLYSAIPVFSGLDALRRALRDGDWHWLWHPVASVLQTETYLEVLLGTNRGRKYLKGLLARNDS